MIDAAYNDLQRRHPRPWLAGVVLASSIAIVYGPALDVPLIFDDDASIVENGSIRSLWPLIGVSRPGPLNPPRDLPTTSRPLVNLSFALNYHFGGRNPTGYHAVNAMLHFATALLLWSIVRRTLLLPCFAGRFDAVAGWLALAVSLLWAMHPLVTETVIYATQRTELMMAFCYLATLYCSLRYWALASTLSPHEAHGDGRELSASSSRRRWLVLAIVVCCGGMASKEVMVSAPLMVLLFERTFVAGSLGQALRRSWPLYIGLAATWLLLIVLRMSVEPSRSAGFGLGVPAYAWWLTQTKVFWMYMKLAIWPAPLLLHYELPYFTSLSEAWIYALPLLLLGILTLALLWRNTPTGYLLTLVFAALSPTFVVPITTEMAAERRMYLPLAALVVLLIIGAHRLAEVLLARRAVGSQEVVGQCRADQFFTLANGWVDWHGLGGTPTWPSVSEILHAHADESMPPKTAQHETPIGPGGQWSALAVTAGPVALLAIAAGIASASRLADYGDELLLWQQVVGSQPGNYMAHASMARALKTAGKFPESIAEYKVALELRPKYARAHSNLGVAYLDAGQLDEALAELQAALALDPENEVAHNNLGIALARQGRPAEAVEHFAAALNVRPDYDSAHNNLGLALATIGKTTEAIDHLQQSLALGGDDFNTRNNLGRIYAQTGDFSQAATHFARAVELNPIRADIQNNLGEALRRAGRPLEAIPHCQAALALDPKFLQAYAELALAFAAANRLDEAVATTELAINAARAAKQEVAIAQFESLRERFRADAR